MKFTRPNPPQIPLVAFIARERGALLKWLPFVRKRPEVAISVSARQRHIRMAPAMLLLRIGASSSLRLTSCTRSYLSKSSSLLSGRVSSFHRNALLAMPEIPFKLADIGEGIAEVEVLQWFVKDGDTIKQFQNVCEVQSDKVSIALSGRFTLLVA